MSMDCKDSTTEVQITTEDSTKNLVAERMLKEIDAEILFLNNISENEKTSFDKCKIEFLRKERKFIINFSNK